MLAMLAWRGHLAVGDSVSVPAAVVTTTARARYLLLLCLCWLRTSHSILLLQSARPSK